MNSEGSRVGRGRETLLGAYAVVGFAVLIAGLGALMMTITSSGQMKGAAMLWIPAALQLMAGVWLGPKRGFVAGAVGAYAAGIIAYGGWGVVDIIMNPVAGGIANSFLPGLLFSLFRIDASFGAEKHNLKKAFFTSFALLLAVLFAGTLPIFTGIGNWGYALATILLLLALPLAMRGFGVQVWSLLGAALICVFCCALSALIGSYGVYVNGAPWKAALVGTGIGWFLGDTVSCFLGLYMLALFTDKARRKGIAGLAKRSVRTE